MMAWRSGGTDQSDALVGRAPEFSLADVLLGEAMKEERGLCGESTLDRTESLECVLLAVGEVLGRRA